MNQWSVVCTQGACLGRRDQRQIPAPILSQAAERRAWSQPLPFRSDIDWVQLSGVPGVTVDLIRSKTLADGELIFPYDQRLASESVVGLVMLQALSSDMLLTASYNILDGLEGVLFNARAH